MKPVPLQVVVAVVHNRTYEKLLFQERSKEPYKGYFGLVGGKVQSGESLESAILREMKEETSLVAKNVTYVKQIHETLVTNGIASHVVMHVYDIEATGKARGNLLEGHVHWFDQNHLNVERDGYIPSDWLITRAIIDKDVIFDTITVEQNGYTYAVTDIK